LLRPELDIWQPGEHSGTFRGTNPAFVTAIAAMDFWQDATLEKETLDKGDRIASAIRQVASEFHQAVSDVRGRGMAWGIAFHEPATARQICACAFDQGLLVETSGARSEVVKLMPPLTISDQDLAEGLRILRDAISSAAPASTARQASTTTRPASTARPT
jgi:diaminobutyrate-2-oxoglutarate transaminase